MCMTYRDTMFYVAEAVSVRLDQDSVRALRKLQATGLSQSEAIRRAIRVRTARTTLNMTAAIAALEARGIVRDRCVC